MNVSIIIPSYNGRALLEKNLPSVLAAMREGDEVIIVDDASTDDTLKHLKTTYGLVHYECIPNQETGIPPADRVCYRGIQHRRTIKVLVNSTNQRFASSCNRGVESAMTDVVILLNNDVSVDSNFLAPLLKHFDESRVFAVGCKELATAEGNKEYGRSEGWFERGFYVHRRAVDQNGTETAWVAGGSGAFRKSMWKELGGFDLDFRPAYGEDIDLCFRARSKGWGIRFEPRSIVHHNHESTNASVFGQRNIEIMSFKNACLFMWKTAPFPEKLKHFCWLPYHLVFSTLRSRGAFLQGFVQALLTTGGLQ